MATIKEIKAFVSDKYNPSSTQWKFVKLRAIRTLNDIALYKDENGAVPSLDYIEGFIDGADSPAAASNEAVYGTILWAIRNLDDGELE